MRVIHVVENLNRGGAERVVVDLAREQKRQGDDCLVLCLFEAGELAAELESAGVPVHACHKKAGFDRRALALLRRSMREFRPDVMHSHNAMPHYYAVFASLGLPLVRINTRHGMGDLLDNSRQRWLYRLAMLVTRSGCCVCDAARRQFVRSGAMPSTRAVTTYNGIDVAAFQHATGALRSLLGLGADVRLVGTVGRLNRAKDHGNLLRAFEMLAADDAGLHLVVIGEGEERARLESAIAISPYGDRVHLTGSRPDVPALLPDLSLFMLSSVTEGFSIALLEAGMAGLAVVATDVGGNSEIVGRGERGVLVPARDPAALADAARALLDDPGRAGQLGGALRGWVAENCGLGAMEGRYRQIYQRAGVA